MKKETIIPQMVIDITEQGINYLLNNYAQYEGKDEFILTDIYWEMVEEIRYEFDTDTPTIFGEIGEEIVCKYLYRN